MRENQELSFEIPDEVIESLAVFMAFELVRHCAIQLKELLQGFISDDVETG